MQCSSIFRFNEFNWIVSKILVHLTVVVVFFCGSWGIFQTVALSMYQSIRHKSLSQALNFCSILCDAFSISFQCDCEWNATKWFQTFQQSTVSVCENCVTRKTERSHRQKRDEWKKERYSREINNKKTHKKHVMRSRFVRMIFSDSHWMFSRLQCTDAFMCVN